MINLTSNKMTGIPAVHYGPGGAGPVTVDREPEIELTGIKNDESLSIICLSNGIELETNHDDSFIMNDTVSGYYFTSLQNGQYVFGKAGEKIAVIRL
ncbi:MAG: hypothetical protein GY940_31735, partial [bacterium]|nr:hypothetical protein [bacterium]